MVKVGIIGCGGVAITRHIPALKKAEGAVLHGFFDGIPERTSEFADTYGARAYASLEEMLADPELTAVEVCTATRSHCDLAVAALEAGKHVLSEKPMAASAADARKMIAAADKSGKKLMVSHNQRLYEPHQRAKELLDCGAIGKLLTYRTFLGTTGPEFSSVLGAKNAYFSKEKSGRGVVADVGSHRIDLMRYITGMEYRRIFAYTPTLAKRYPDGRLIEVDDNAFAIAEMDSGVVGTIITSWSSVSGNDRMTQFFGTEGVLTLYGGDCPLKLEKPDRSVTRIEFRENPHQDVVLLTHIDQLFVDCIRFDTEPFVTGRDGLAVVNAIDAMEESNRTGTWAEVRQD